MAGNDLRKMSPQSQSLLTNKEAIAINQDAMGVSAYRVSAVDSLEIWVKPMSNNNWAVCFLNRANHPQKVNYTWAQHGLQDAQTKQGVDFSKTTYKLREVWAGKDVGSTKTALKQTIPAHDAIMFRLTR
jgi:alpha-galactosidase